MFKDAMSRASENLDAMRSRVDRNIRSMLERSLYGIGSWHNGNQMTDGNRDINFMTNRTGEGVSETSVSPITTDTSVNNPGSPPNPPGPDPTMPTPGRPGRPMMDRDGGRRPAGDDAGHARFGEYQEKKREGFWRYLWSRFSDRLYTSVLSLGGYDSSVAYLLKRRLRQIKYQIEEEIPGLELPFLRKEKTQDFRDLRELYVAYLTGAEEKGAEEGLKSYVVEYLTDHLPMIKFVERKLGMLEYRVKSEMLQLVTKNMVGDNKQKGETTAAERALREFQETEQRTELLSERDREMYARQMIRSAKEPTYVDSVLFSYLSEIIKSIQTLYGNILDKAGQSKSGTFFQMRIPELVNTYKDLIKNAITAPIEYFVNQQIFQAYKTFVPKLKPSPLLEYDHSGNVKEAPNEQKKSNPRRSYWLQRMFIGI